MIKELTPMFYWNTMVNDVNEFQASCLHCLATKDGIRTARPFGKLLIGEVGGEVIQIDHATMDVRSKDYKHVLVIIDTLSNYTKLYPCHSTGAEEASRALTDWVTTFRIPSWIVSDSGTGLVSALIKKLTDNLHIQRHTVCTYHHTGNAKVERSIRTIIELFKNILSELRVDPKEWSLVLPIVQIALNSTKENLWEIIQLLKYLWVFKKLGHWD